MGASTVSNQNARARDFVCGKMTKNRKESFVSFAFRDMTLARKKNNSLINQYEMESTFICNIPRCVIARTAGYPG
jgi:hypothetical protein